MDFSKKLLMSTYRFPVVGEPPTFYNADRVATAPTGSYILYVVEEDGWYRVTVCGAGGGGGAFGTAGGAGGKTVQSVYLYQGQTCLLWAGVVGTGTAYPGESTNELGGRGGYGHDESGAGGGAPGTSGTGSPHWEGGLPGQGSGFLAGFSQTTVENFNITAGNMVRNTNHHLDAGVFDFQSITAYVLGAGGGGGCSDSGDNRSGGGGGGAFGDGGGAYWVQEYPTSGPAGSAWGVGQAGGRYGGGGNGAWAVVDFSRNTSSWGQGGGSSGAAGYAYLDKLVSPYAEVWTEVFSKTSPGSYSQGFGYGKYRVVMSGGGGAGGVAAVGGTHLTSSESATNGSAAQSQEFYFNIAQNTTSIVSGVVGAGATSSTIRVRSMSAGDTSVGTPGTGYEGGTRGSADSYWSNSEKEFYASVSGSGGGSTNANVAGINHIARGGNGGTAQDRRTGTKTGGTGGSGGVSSGTGASGGNLARGVSGTVSSGAGSNGYIHIYMSNFPPE